MSPSAAVGIKGFVDTFTGPGGGHQMLIKPGETLQYYLEMAGANEGVGVVQLEYTQDGGQRWVVENANDDSQIKFTGTIADPLLGQECLGWVKNESPKNKLYRWRCVSMDRSVSAGIPCHISKHLKATLKLTDTVFILIDNEAPTGGADGDGAGFAGRNSLYIDTSATGGISRNEGTAALPNWAAI